MNPGGRCTYGSVDFESPPVPAGLRNPEPGEVRWLMELSERAIPPHRGIASRYTRDMRVMKLFLALMAANCFFCEGA